MLTESQERMLVVVRKGHEKDVSALFRRWEVHWAIIGHVTDGNTVRIVDGKREAASLPVDILVEAPEYSREGLMPPEIDEMWSTGPHRPSPTCRDANAALLRLLASPNIARKRWIYRQYDQRSSPTPSSAAGADAAVLRIKGTDTGIAVTTDGNGRYCYLDPYRRRRHRRRRGRPQRRLRRRQPVAVTDCLNFGNPERPEVYYQLQGVVQGIADACATLGTPVISGNVSLYNETGGTAVYPTPVIGMLGLLEDVTRHCRMGFANEGDEVFLLGSTLEQPVTSLAGSEYLKEEHKLIGGQLNIDLALEDRVQKAALAAIRQGIATACHDCSDGGLAVALAEMCLAGNKGLDASQAPLGVRFDAALFGETQSRIIVGLPPGRREALIGVARGLDIPFAYIGRVSRDQRLRLGPIDLPLEDLRDAYENALERALSAS